MFRRLAQMPVDALGGSRFYLDYVRSGSEGVAPFVTGPSLDAGMWRERSRALRDMPGRDSRDAVMKDIHALSKRCGADARTLDKVARAQDGSVHFVVTGQQPGVLGGPLMTLYKVLTAVALAQRLEDMTGESVVPLYWCGSDDTDFQEIRELHLVTKDASPVSTELQAGAHSGGLPVGDIDAEASRQLWKSVRSFVAAFDESRAKEIDSIVGGASDHGEIAARVVCSLLGGRVAVVDGRSAAMRRHAQRVFVDYLRDEDAIKRRIAEQGSRLEAAGYHAQLSVGSDSGVFLIEDGRRKTVSRERHGELLKAAENDPQRCSPGVVVRNLVQDFTFTPLAAVLGPAEIAYRAQIGFLYEQLGIARPVDFPRLGATFVPGALRSLVCGDGATVSTLDAEALVTDPAACARRVYSEAVPATVRDAAAAFSETVAGAATRLAGAVDAGLSDRAKGKVRSRIKDFEARSTQVVQSVEDAGRRVALERWPFLSELTTLIRPEEKLQERYYSCLIPFLFGGAEADSASLIEMAGQYVDDLLDGRANHTVYSTQT